MIVANRGKLGWGSLVAFIAGMLQAIAQEQLPAPQPRVQEVYSFAAKDVSRWEVSDAGPVVFGTFEREDRWFKGMTYWTQPGVSVFSAGWDFYWWNRRIVMRGETMFTENDNSRVIQRPLTADGTSSSFEFPSGWDFVAVSGQEIVLKQDGYPAKERNLGFMNRDGSHSVFEVDPGMSVRDIVARENDFVLYGGVGKRGMFARMEQPRIGPGAVYGAKVSRVAANPEAVHHFGSRFALFEQNRVLQLLVWGDKGADSILRVPGLTHEDKFIGVTASDEAVYVSRGPRELLRIAPGQKEAKVTVVPLPAGLGIDSIRGGKEDSLFVLSKLKKSIVRLDTTPTSQLDVSPAAAGEIDGVIRFKVTLQPASPVPVTFAYETRPLGATPNADYTPVAGTATLSAGATEVFVEVPLIEDLTIEPAESFEFHLTGISGARCDRPVVTGRILGSGGPRKVGTTSTPGNQQEFERSMVTNLIFPEGVAEASRLGYVGFVPVTPNSGPYFYASGWTLENAEKGWGGGKFCQFDAVTGELLEEFEEPWFWNVTGNQMLVRTGNSLDTLIRKEFFDGFPALDFSGRTLAEGGGTQEIVARSERTSKAILCEILAADPLLGLTGISMDGEGRFRLQASPPDDGGVWLQRTFEVQVRLTDPESGATSSQWIAVKVVDDDYLFTKQVKFAGQSQIQALAADGNRLVVGYTGSVNAFELSGETLVAKSQMTMPDSTRMYGALELEGGRVAFGTNSRNGQNGLQLLGLERGVKGWKAKSAKLPSSAVFAGRYLAAGEWGVAGGTAGRVRILDAASGKEVRVIEAPDGSPGFGYDLAFSADTLWVASPPAGMPFGKVYGYSMADFSKVREITSPEPEVAGIFAMSIAADEDQLVVGEPRGANGIVWVFDVTSGAMLKKLGSLKNQPVPNLGARVTTRSGRILATGGGSVSGLNPVLAPAAVEKPSKSSVIIINPPVGGGNLPVALWESRDSSARYLQPQGGSFFFQSSGRIALLENAAVYSYMSFNGDRVEQGLEVCFLQQPASADSAMAGPALKAAALPLWPRPGALEPQWTFRRTESGDLEAEVNMAAVDSSGMPPLIEWSDDLKVWHPVTEEPESVGSSLLIPLLEEATPRRFLRLRMSGNE